MLCRLISVLDLSDLVECCLLYSNSLLSCSQDQYMLCFEIIQSYLDSCDSYANFKAV